MADNAAWAQGYARQALADFGRFQELQASDAPECHKLQFLQMACEKLAKAYLCGEGTDPTTLQSSHAYIAGTLPVVLRQYATFVGVRGAKARAVLTLAKHVSREIELLAPAVRRGGGRPDNCEYPWEDATGTLHVPLDWTFAPNGMLGQPKGRDFLKLVRGAIGRLLS